MFVHYYYEASIELASIALLEHLLYPCLKKAVLKIVSLCTLSCFVLKHT